MSIVFEKANSAILQCPAKPFSFICTRKHVILATKMQIHHKHKFQAGYGNFKVIRCHLAIGTHRETKQQKEKVKVDSTFLLPQI